jgi:hypothetical protein
MAGKTGLKRREQMKKPFLLFMLALSLTLSLCAQGSGTDATPQEGGGTMIIKISGGREFTATLVKNSSTAALKELLKVGPITINMRDYGNMEKFGGLGKSLPTNDERITTEPGDLILYQGNALAIYYAPNTWTFTRLGKINDVKVEELKAVLGEGNVTVKLEVLE